MGRRSERVRRAMTPAMKPPAPTASMTGSGFPAKSEPTWTMPKTTAWSTFAPSDPSARAPQPMSAPRKVISSSVPLARATTSAARKAVSATSSGATS